MAESLINSIARLRVIEKRLLTKETVSRLAAAPGYEECLKILSETGYGAKADPAGDDRTEALIRAELADAYALAEELMPSRFAHICELFRMRRDLTNIKLLYKLRLMGEDPEKATLGFGGVFDGEKLKAAVKKGDYSMLPKKFAAALEELDVSTYRGADPQAVSCRLDSAFIEYALASRSGFAREYFGALADFTNLIAIARGVPAEYDLPSGTLGKDKLEKLRTVAGTAPEKAGDIIRNPLETGELLEKLRGGFEEYLKTGRTSGLERARDEYLIGLVSKNRSDIDSPAPIVGYMLAREREAEVIRLILTAKRSGIPAQAIEERSMALYG